MPLSPDPPPPAPAARTPRWRRRAAVAARALVVALAAVTLLASAARATWLGDLLVNFRVQYALAGLALAAAFAWRRRPAWTVIALVACGMNGSAAWPWLAPDPPVASAHAATPPGVPTIRVAAVNLFFLNRDVARVTSMLRTERPDVAVLVEVTPRWTAALEPLRAEYPYWHLESVRGNGTLLASKYPLEHVRAVGEGRRGVPLVAATVVTPTAALDVVGVHATWPMTPRLAARRNREFDRIAEIARSSANPVVVLGDFNASPFSPHFSELLRAGRLRSAAEGRGWLPTWPTFAPALGIQIDHALVSAGVRVEDVWRGPPTGSDHRPLVADLALEPRASLSSADRKSRGPS